MVKALLPTSISCCLFSVSFMLSYSCVSSCKSDACYQSSLHSRCIVFYWRCFSTSLQFPSSWETRVAQQTAAQHYAEKRSIDSQSETFTFIQLSPAFVVCKSCVLSSHPPLNMGSVNLHTTSLDCLLCSCCNCSSWCVCVFLTEVFQWTPKSKLTDWGVVAIS